MTAVQRAPGVPTSTPKSIPKYQQVAESKYELDWADLVTLDLSQFDVPGGKEKLAHQLRDAVHNVGFFYITNFGLSQEEVDRQFAIGKQVFDLPVEDRLKHRADLEHGNYNGYRPRGTIELFPGLRDNVEMYNMFKFIPELERSQVDIVNENRPEIERFQRHIAEDIIPKLLSLIAIILEVPEDTLLNAHKFDDVSECHLRYITYRARTAEENEKYQNLYSKGHTDFGSLTLLFRQPIAALQIRTGDGTWKWVKPYPGSITVNIADVLQFWTNGYLKSSIHRVVAPPPDQAHLDRLGLMYFARPSGDTTLKSLDSPLLKRLGLEGDEKAAGIKAGDWVKARVKGNSDKAVEGGLKEKAVVGGIKVKYYD
ncbi:Clavaminate synthase-like protein [Rhizodiscina lignyota]|uniref:Clavaminate synthase-like protein n=1 Tax=Rhizodiscina lignyota TaxID=1504668 RepID=A0A9P4I972_9PEZI|nr:Clavaminate synthase-like protein [Rhizodiscina lignyota]